MVALHSDIPSSGRSPKGLSTQHTQEEDQPSRRPTELNDRGQLDTEAAITDSSNRDLGYSSLHEISTDNPQTTSEEATEAELLMSESKEAP